MNLGLNNKIALVTGASQGLGFATARQLAKEGAKVIIASRNAERVQQAVAEIQDEIKHPEHITGVVFDAMETEKIKAFIDEQANVYGGLDILVTNTAGPKAGMFDEITQVDLDSAYKQLLASTFELIQSASSYLKKSDYASILTITSISAKQAIPGLTLSNIFRPAVAALSKNLSQEYGPDGIRVNSILPGWTSTTRTQQLLQADGLNFNQTQIEQDIPLRRIATPEEFANVATFLVSPAASYLTGIMLPVDGGKILGLS